MPGLPYARWARRRRRRRLPSLANNPKLAVAGYPLALVLKGQRAMPAVGAFLDDEQVAAVVGFIRTHFGNDYREAVAAADVGAMR
ncbi:hypothetical protein ACFQU2_02505 [Siccirubricoccus deserti]